MPYIKQSLRRVADQYGDPAGPGELNYLITQLILKYVREKGVNYAVLNEAIGVLEAVKLEFYRRLVAQYEETKIIENGDVY